MKNGRYSFPLTMADRHSRLVGCDALHPTCESDSMRISRRHFQEYGLPERIRTGNGVPFATYSLGRLSHGHLVDASGHPPLKAEATRPPDANLRAQQCRFATFRENFNHERPHEAIEQKPPTALYRPAGRPMPDRLPPLE